MPVNNAMTNSTTLATYGAIVDRAERIGGIKGKLVAAAARAAIKTPNVGERIALQRCLLDTAYATKDGDIVAMVNAIQGGLIASGFYQLPAEVRAAF